MLISLREIKYHLRLPLEADSDLDPYLDGLYGAALDYCRQYLSREIPWSTETESAVFPDAVRSAMLLIIGDLYENRERVVVGTITATIPTADAMLHFYRDGLGV